MTAPSLRDHILERLSTTTLLPHHPRLQVYCLSSAPRKCKELFAYAEKPGKCLETDFLVVLSAEVQVDGRRESQTQGGSSVVSDVAESESAAAGPAQSTASTSSSSSRTRNVFTSALYATMYTLPSQDTSLIYISKLDSSALGPRLPLTAALTRAFLSYHLDPLTRPSKTVKVCLFARSQGQYLFPNSKDRKKLGGLRLCGWWKALLESVVLDLDSMDAARGSTSEQVSKDGDGGKQGRQDTLDLTYLLPSYSSDEAAGMLGLPKHTLPAGIAWRYAPPFVAPLLGPSSSAAAAGPSGSDGLSDPGRRSLATIIPAFDDDPKERFLVELVEADPFLGNSKQPEDSATATAKTERTSKKSSTDPSAVSQGKKRKRRGGTGLSPAEEEAERQHSQAVLSRTSIDEYWERMGFRQECASGDVTGFFTLTIGSHPAVPSEPSTKPEEQRQQPGRIPQDLLSRLLEALLNTDFGSLSTSADGTELWIRTAKTLVESEVKEEGWKSLMGELEAKRPVTPEGAGGVQDGSASQTSASEMPKRKEEVVTMLQPRKKKRV